MSMLRSRTNPENRHYGSHSNDDSISMVFKTNKKKEFLISQEFRFRGANQI